MTECSSISMNMISSSAAMPTTTTVIATCICKAFSLTINFPTSTLPIPRAHCLCNTCRRITGTCGASYIPLPNEEIIDPSFASPPLTTYSTSADLKRYSCSKCGSQIACQSLSDNMFHIATGLFDRTEGIIQWIGTMWVEETLDGGISDWLTSIKDVDGKSRELNMWKLASWDTDPNSILPRNWKEDPKRAKVKTREDLLQAQCHCGGVRFSVTRPSAASKLAFSPFPDLMVPFNSGASAANPSKEPWFIRCNDTKYLAGLCTCTSCRYASGHEIQTWAFIPRCNIVQEDGETLRSDYKLGTLQSYDGSLENGVKREFCATCGSTVFWHCDWRPDVVDVSTGLFNPDEGARAEGWLDWWTERVSFEELAVSRSLLRSLEAGIHAWGANR